MRQKRKYHRFKRRLETEFTVDNHSCRGISSEISMKGLFIKTNNVFVPGTTIHLLLHLPDGSTSKLQGIIKNAMKTHTAYMKNGMGIELIEKDSHFINFIKAIPIL